MQTSLLYMEIEIFPIASSSTRALGARSLVGLVASLVLLVGPWGMAEWSKPHS